MIKQHFTQILPDETATIQAGIELAAKLTAGLVVFLYGDLGAGKTTFVRGVLKGLAYQGRVKSPTYTIVEPYVVSNFTLYHFDLYRFNDEEEWEMAGFREHFNPDSVCMIEWPDKAANLLPQADVELHLSLYNNGRKIEVIANTEKAINLFTYLEDQD